MAQSAHTVSGDFDLTMDELRVVALVRSGGPLRMGILVECEQDAAA